MTETRKDLLNNLIYQINLQRKGQSVPFKIGIDGVDAAGKTRLASELLEIMQNDYYPVIHTFLDRFHNPRKIRYSLGENSPEGYYQRSFDYDKLLEFLLLPLSNDSIHNVRTACFDHIKNKTVKPDFIQAASDTILLFDGIFLAKPKLRKFWDLLIFVHSDFEVILKRANERDIQHFKTETELHESYLNKYIPGQILYLQDCQPHLQADILINNNNYDHPYFIVNNREKELFLNHSIQFFNYFNRKDVESTSS